MNINDLNPVQRQAAEILRPLLAAYPNAKISADSIFVYAVALSELPPAKLQAGVLRCMRTCKPKFYGYFPSIAEIMEAAQEVTDYVSGTKMASPDEAWNEVQQQMQEAFIYKTPVFSTPEVKRAALAMGWIGLCETPTNQIGTARAQFLRLYESVCNTHQGRKVNDSVVRLVGGENAIRELASSVAKDLPKIEEGREPA